VEKNQEAFCSKQQHCSGRYDIYVNECHEEERGQISAVGDVKPDIKHTISLLVFCVALLTLWSIMAIIVVVPHS
jgi:hypothetical protein